MKSDPPIAPLRPLDIKRVRHEGGEYLMLRDPLELGGDGALLMPLALGPLLALLDGRHTAAMIAGRLPEIAGFALTAGEIGEIVRRLSEACLLEDAHAVGARAAALARYHAAPARPSPLAGRVFAADPAVVLGQFRRFEQRVDVEPAVGEVTGVVSPHIDYGRGGPVYAAVWRAAAQAAREAEVAVIFGTDHAGGPGQITLTRQDYATPWGRLPTDEAGRQAVADALGGDAYAEELHHRGEHSVELAALWLHHVRDRRPLPVLPVLCGHPGPMLAAGGIEPASAAGRTLAALRSALAGRRALVVAAADFAHVGPAFGDRLAFGAREKAAVRAADEVLIAAMRDGPPAVLAEAAAIDDRYRICGLSPMALLLGLLGPSTPELVAYDHCPADDDGGSIVSIAGILLRPARGERSGGP